MTPAERLREVEACRDAALRAESEVAKRLTTITHAPDRGLLSVSRMLQALRALESARVMLDGVLEEERKYQSQSQGGI